MDGEDEAPAAARRPSKLHTVTLAQRHLTETLADVFCRKKRWQLIAAILCGAVAVYVHASSWMSQTLFGKNWERSWLWWCVAVPIDVCLAIYFTRFVGSFVGRIWLQEISESAVTRQAIIALLTGLVRDARVPGLVTALLEHDQVVGAARGLTAGVLRCPGVREAAAGAMASVLSSPETQDATAEAACAVMQRPRLVGAVEALLDSQQLARPLAGQVARLLDDNRVQSAVSRLMHEVLQDDDVREVLHHRAVSLMGDKNVYEAGRKGVAAAMFPSRYGDSGGT